MSLSTSPTSILAYDAASDAYSDASLFKSNSISLQEFIDALPPILRHQKQNERSSLQGRMQVETARGTHADPINQLFSRLDLSKGEWKEYALSDPMKNYTRNLVATDNETFTLLLLCWHPNKTSPIHDHPCDGCWVRVCEGSIQETRYNINENENCLVVTSDELFEGELCCTLSCYDVYQAKLARLYY